MKKRYVALAVYAVLVLICIVIIYVVPPVAGLFESTYIAEYGSLEVSNEVEAVVIRDDTVYMAKKAGEINRLVDEGTLVRTGSKILELKGEGKEEITGKYEDAIERLGDAAGKSEGGSQKAGYVTFQMDGYEDVFKPSRLKKITREQFDAVSDKDIVEMPDKSCAKGEPISRITSNGAWWLLTYIDNQDAGRYVEGDSIDIVLGDETVEGKVTRVKKSKEYTKVIIQSKMKCTGYLTTRKPTVKLVTSNADGIILHKESLITIDDQLGVIVINSVGDKYFTPVRVKADNGEQVAVYEDLYMDDDGNFVETLDNYDEIMRSPADKDIEEIKAEMKADE